MRNRFSNRYTGDFRPEDLFFPDGSVRLPDTPDNELVRLTYATGWVEYLAELLGVSVNAVHQRARRLGVTRRKLTDDDWVLIRSLLASGTSINQVAKKFDVTRRTIRMGARKHG